MHHHWANIQNCRTFFDEYARENGLDPLKEETWYGVTQEKLLDKQVGDYHHAMPSLPSNCCMFREAIVCGRNMEGSERH